MVTVSYPLTPPPLHGYRGDPAGRPQDLPRGLTIAISREAGARGGSIARRVGQSLGWQVYNQEMLGFLTQDVTARRDLLASVPDEGREWADRRVAELVAVRPQMSEELIELVRLVFALAARGEVVIVGRGAGFLLPVERTLNVRVVAPHSERIAYISQWLRMTTPEATAEVASRDRMRAELHQAVADRDPADLTQYDLVLNSGRLGEAATAELIVLAGKAKLTAAPAPDATAVEPV